MAIVLTHEVINNARAAVNAYIQKANALYSNLNEIVAQVSNTAFSGDAADGYVDFYQSKVTPAITENSVSLMGGIISMLDSIEEQLLNTVDPELGNANRMPYSDSPEIKVMSSVALPPIALSNSTEAPPQKPDSDRHPSTEKMPNE